MKKFGWRRPSFGERVKLKGGERKIALEKARKVRKMLQDLRKALRPLGFKMGTSYEWRVDGYGGVCIVMRNGYDNEEQFNVHLAVKGSGWVNETIGWRVDGYSIYGIQEQAKAVWLKVGNVEGVKKQIAKIKRICEAGREKNRRQDERVARAETCDAVFRAAAGGDYILDTPLGGITHREHEGELVIDYKDAEDLQRKLEILKNLEAK